MWLSSAGRSPAEIANVHHEPVGLVLDHGFTLYMVKALISGRGDEIIDLARTNLRRQFGCDLPLQW